MNSESFYHVQSPLGCSRIIQDYWYHPISQEENELKYDEQLQFKEELDDLRNKMDTQLQRIILLEESVVLNGEKIIKLEQRIEEQTRKYNELKNDWIAVTNRLLETETYLERTKNLLVRKNISFPFISEHKL